MRAEDNSSSWLGTRSDSLGREGPVTKNSGSDFYASTQVYINTMDLKNLHAEIVSSETRPEAGIIGRKNYTGYFVTVSITSADHHWTVVRRYSEFRKLYIALKGWLPPNSKFPRRRLFRNMDAAFVAQRRSDLDVFIKKVMLLAPEHRLHPALDSFLELSENLAQPIMAEAPSAADSTSSTDRSDHVPAKPDVQNETSSTKSAAEQAVSNNTPAITVDEMATQRSTSNYTAPSGQVPAEDVPCLHLDQSELENQALFHVGSQSSSQSENMADREAECHVRGLESLANETKITTRDCSVANTEGVTSVTAAELTVPEISANEVAPAENGSEATLDLALPAGAVGAGSIANTEKVEGEEESCVVETAIVKPGTVSKDTATNDHFVVDDSMVNASEQNCEAAEASVGQATGHALDSLTCVSVAATSSAVVDTDISDTVEQADGLAQGVQAGNVSQQHTGVNKNSLALVMGSDWPEPGQGMSVMHAVAAEDRSEETLIAMPEKQTGTWQVVSPDDAEPTNVTAQPSYNTSYTAATEEPAPEENHGSVDTWTSPQKLCYSNGDKDSRPAPESMLQDQDSPVHPPSISLVKEWLDDRMNAQAEEPQWTEYDEPEARDLWPEDMRTEGESEDSEDDGYRAFNQEDMEPKYGVGMIDLNYKEQEQLEKKALANKKRCVQFPDVIDFWDAVKEGNVEKVDQFLATNAKDINARSALDFTPLMCASLLGHMSLVLYLIHQGADLDAVNFEACTALHYAVIEGDVQIARALIHAGADFTIRDYEGKTPVELTEDEELLDVMERELQEHGLLDVDVEYSGLGDSDFEDQPQGSQLGQAVGGTL